MTGNKAKTLSTELKYFYELGCQTIKALEVPYGILASSGQELYGCIFGRDSLITALKLLQAYNYEKDGYYLSLTKKILSGLLNLLGKEINIESGEEPGKCIHEFRATGHERLTKALVPAWFLYPDDTMRNFDSVDATPLLLIAIYRYWQKSKDDEFVAENLNAINSAIGWIFDYSDKNGDGFIDYQKHPERKSGGLEVQSWMDSSESVFHEDEIKVTFPIAPVEAQGYCYLALKLWSRYFEKTNQHLAKNLNFKANKIKKQFNAKFIWFQKGLPIFAHAIDNAGRPLISLRSSIGHLLWASLNPTDDKISDCILQKQYIRPLVKKIMQPDMFEKEAGIRTLSKRSRLYEPNSYHNGTIWPHDNSLIAEGLENFGFKKQARLVRLAMFKAYNFFQTPIELFGFDENKYLEYKSEGGQIACRQQAWSAASMLADSLALTNGKVSMY